MDEYNSDILIIGAGMAGLSCASTLAACNGAETGLGVRLIDKGRGPGGRMAARRAEIDGASVSFDHGAQYFTARDPGFQAAVEAWAAAGVAARWDSAGAQAWVGTPGMNGPIKAMAEPLDVRWGVRALGLECSEQGWSVDCGDQVFSAGAVLICVPAEQATELLMPVAPDLAAIPAGVRSEPCWAVMAAFGEKLSIATDVVRSSDTANSGPIAWAARNSAKPGRAGLETWVLHASPGRSREVLDLPPQEVAQLLLADFFAEADIAPVAPIHTAAHRWLYAMPAALEGKAAFFDAGSGIGIAGDYLHSPRVEGAWLSGRALAQMIIASFEGDGS